MLPVTDDEMLATLLKDFVILVCIGPLRFMA